MKKAGYEDRVYQLGQDKRQKIWLDIGHEAGAFSEELPESMPIARTTILVVPPNCAQADAIVEGCNQFMPEKSIEDAVGGKQTRLKFAPHDQTQLDTLLTKVGQLLEGLGYYTQLSPNQERPMQRS